MNYLYKLQISFSPSRETLNAVNSILEIEHLSDDENPSQWIYEVEQQESDKYFDFINSFLDILEAKYSELQKLNIERENISFWMFYEYDHQCNMEFEPERMKRIGESGITLCISCWQK